MLTATGKTRRHACHLTNQTKHNWDKQYKTGRPGHYSRGDESGATVKDRPVTVPDLFATLLSAFGVDGSRSYQTPEGRPIKLADKGRIVGELFS